MLLFVIAKPPYILHQQKRKHSEMKKKVLILLFILVTLLIFAFWIAGEPSRRAKNIYKKLKPGMILIQVENLLIGRTYCFYQVNRTGTLEGISREEFVRLLENKTYNPSVNLRLWLTFMGSSPGRISFFVEFDKGIVSKITNPYGWD